MSRDTFSPQDPKFTAYALGELEPAETAAIEAELRENPAAQALVEEIRATAAQLNAVLAAEATGSEGAEKVAIPALPALSHAAIVAGKDFRKLDGGPLPPYEDKKLIRFPHFYYIAGLAAAACFAVVVALREPSVHPVKVKLAAQSQDKVYPSFDVGADLASAPVAESIREAPTPIVVEAPKPAPVVSELSLADAQKPAPTFEPLKIDGLTASEVRKQSEPKVAPAAAAAANGANAESSTRMNRQLAGGVEAGPTPGIAEPQRKDSTPRLAKNEMEKREPTARTNSNLQDVDGAVTLSPFQVSAEREDKGYYAANTLGGSRLALAPGESRGMPETSRARRIATNTESYSRIAENEFLEAEKNPLSTFSVDVDTASYANVRRFIERGQLPPRDAVRIEEMVNYFPYGYAGPKNDEPFGASLEVASAPWAPNHRLVRIGLKARDVSTRARPAANLVFLVDVSGSMNAPNRLPLVKESMSLLLGRLRADDHVAIVTYAGNSGLALPSTPVARSREILDALTELTPGGGTNGAIGIQLAYDIAKANFVRDGVNRVILCTDGDFNVGVSSERELTRLIEEKAKSGVFLTVLGFGMGNLKDSMLEKLADRGNGHYGYIDSRREAEKMLVEQVNGTLVTVAKDVKIQVEFNPAKVASYRLIGYENRRLNAEDFNNDQVDAGEVGAGHTVTALYEIVPVGAEDGARAAGPAVDELKYSSPETGRTKVANARANAKADVVASSESDELLTVKLRYKKPGGILSRKLEFPLIDRGGEFSRASADFKFAATVASFGMILRDSAHKGSASLADVLDWVASSDVERDSHRAEFLGLVEAARRLIR